MTTPVDFTEAALKRVRVLTVVVGIVGTAVLLAMQGTRTAAGFLMGAVLSMVNLEGLSKMAFALGGFKRPGPAAAVLIALRYVLIGSALYVIIGLLRFAPVVVLSGLLAAFGAVVLEVFYELIVRRDHS